MRRCFKKYFQRIVLVILVFLFLFVSGCRAGQKTDNQSSIDSEENTNSESYGPFTKEQVDDIKQQLGIPDDVETEARIESEASYWEAAGIHIVYCEFFSNGKLVASAYVDQETGQLARGIMGYEE